MEIFKTVKEHLVAIGFTKPDVEFHTEQVLRTSQGFLAIVLQCLHLLFDANTTKDYLDSLFTTSVGILGKRKNHQVECALQYRTSCVFQCIWHI